METRESEWECEEWRWEYVGNAGNQRVNARNRVANFFSVFIVDKVFT